MSDRMSNYTAKLIPARVAEDLTTKRAQMLSNMGLVIDEQIAVEQLTHGYLGTLVPGIDTTLAVWYLAAAKQMWKASRHWTGGGVFDTEMAVIIAHWVERGYDEATLLGLALAVVGWRPPTPGP